MDAAPVIRAEHAFAATGIYPYSLNISDEDHLRSLAKIRCLMKLWKGPKMSIQILALPFVSMALICLQLLLYQHPII